MSATTLRPPTALRITLLSDTTFGRGDGVAGLVDQEVEHDPATGLPIIKGKTIKGLLVEECANILFGAREQATVARDLRAAALWLFGAPGSTADVVGNLTIETARMPQDLIAYARAEIAAERYTPTDILQSLTTIRRQTSVDEATGAPEEGSLRSFRAVRRGLTLTAPVAFTQPPTETHLALLAACAASLRRGGSGRNRGRGRLAVQLDQDHDQAIAAFERLFGGAQ
ncbi:MAG: RAMP superfamily protein [Dehalococcoidia bacterium]|nr:RAMP superfamily protein [Dehalococcoidia bacterium]